MNLAFKAKKAFYSFALNSSRATLPGAETPTLPQAGGWHALNRRWISGKVRRAFQSVSFLGMFCLSALVFQSMLASPLVAQDFSTTDHLLVGQADVEGTELPPAKKGGINFLRLLTQGGWFMIPLLLLSIGVVTIGIERFLALRREKVFPPGMIEELSVLSQSPGGLDPRRAYQICQRHPSSAAYIMRSMLVKVGRPQQEMESAVSDSSQREATRLAQMTSWLTLAAAIAPLIGLLGTVWGITQAFYDTTQLAEIGAGQNRGVALAIGIYVALVTTMVGLLIAIPSAVLSHSYENRIVQLINEIEEMIFNLLPQFERYEGQVRFTSGDLSQPTASRTTGDSAASSNGDRPDADGSKRTDPASASFRDSSS